MQKDLSLNKELSKYDFTNPDLVQNYLSNNNVIVKEDGSIRFKDDEVEYPLEDGLKSFVEKNPQYLKASQGGSGANGGNLGGKRTISKEELGSLSTKDYAEIRQDIIDKKIEIKD